MSNIVIGIVAKDNEIDSINKQVVDTAILKHIHNKCSYIGILNYDNYDYPDVDVLKLCDGFIFQGGTILYDFHYEILKYALTNHIPVLGICLGHQLIGLNSMNQTELDLLEIPNHQLENNNKHLIKVKEDSIIYKLFGPEIMVNSRHHQALKEVSKDYKVTAMSEDNIIEAIEKVDEEDFIVGVQWHPENMENMEILFNEFIKAILSKKT